MSKQIAPALLLVAFFKICRSGPAADEVTESRSPATNRSIMRKMVPVKVPMPMHDIMILGPSTEAFGISARSE